MKNCKHCSESFEPKRTTQLVCSAKCAYLYAIELQKKKFIKKANKEKKDYYKANKSQKQKVNEARVIFQRWIRERDKYHSCISCGILVASKWDAGHYLKAEKFTGLIFN